MNLPKKMTVNLQVLTLKKCHQDAVDVTSKLELTRPAMLSSEIVKKTKGKGKGRGGGAIDKDKADDIFSVLGPQAAFDAMSAEIPDSETPRKTTTTTGDKKKREFSVEHLMK
jgi:hypothetical protein